MYPEEMLAGEPVAMADMLAARERRAARQDELLRLDARTLLCLTLNIPGPYKSFPLARRVFEEAGRLLGTACAAGGIALHCVDILHLATGDEGYFLAAAPAARMKGLAMEVEDGSSLGRLFDIDVLAAGIGKISRQDLGKPARGCLACGEPSRLCARSRYHSAEELAQCAVHLLREYEISLSKHHYNS